MPAGNHNQAVLLAVLQALGVVAVLYFAGGLLMRVELHHSGLPTDEVLAAIGREKLIVIGVKGLLFPTSLLAAGTVVVFVIVDGVTRRVRPRNEVSTRSPVWATAARSLERESRERWTIGACWAFAIAVGTFGAWEVTRRARVPEPSIEWRQWAIVVCAAVIVVVGATLMIAALRRVQPDERSKRWMWLAGMLLAYFVLAVLAFLWARPMRLPPAIATVRTGQPVTGFLVSQTKDAVYIAGGLGRCLPATGDRSNFGKRLIGPLVVIPRTQLVQLRVGRVVSTNWWKEVEDELPRPGQKQPSRLVRDICGP